jgi:hypothetical protein
VPAGFVTPVPPRDVVPVEVPVDEDEARERLPTVGANERMQRGDGDLGECVSGAGERRDANEDCEETTSFHEVAVDM